MPAAHCYTVFETAAGWCGIGWSDAGVARFHLPEKTAAAAERAMQRRMPVAAAGDPPPAVAAAISAARRYFSGEPTDFADIVLDLDVEDDFFRRVYAAARAVGWGRTTTYGTLAKALGAGPEAARDVGQAMARNPVPLLIPCHRVLAAGGKIGGFSAPGGSAAKQRMLAMEGVSLAPPPARQASFGF
ncbi:MAG TPA: methylated-DNA--[protein]-cysteine S-methyltransferase [Rhizobiales bacterium]|nr:methylated-DNA--[protein]-cysteine S-methyltransferase [Hyphomicrobiales bacterium]